MGVFSDLFLGWAVSRQRKDFLSLIEILKGMDDSEIAYIIQSVEYEKNMIHAECGINLMFPFAAVENHPNITGILYKRVKANEKLHNFVHGTASTIWLYTVRAAARPELRVYGKEMWSEIARGMKDGTWFPDGFDPNGFSVANNIIQEKIVHDDKNKMPSILIARDIAQVLKRDPELGPVLRGESDLIEDYLWPILEKEKKARGLENPFDILCPLIQRAHDEKNHARAISLRMLLLNICGFMYLKGSENYKYILQTTSIDGNPIAKLVYISSYTKTARELGASDTLIELMLKERGISPPSKA